MRRLCLALLLLPAWASGASFYVDCAAGAGGDGSLATPWDAVADVNAASFSAGDSVLFKRGCTWRETLTVPSSGSAGSPITFGAYGTGAQPIISGSDVLTTFTQSADAWAATWTGPSLVDSTAGAANQYRIYVPASAISDSGSTIRIKITAHSTGDIAITGASIGPKKAASDAFDFASAPTRITFDGGSSSTTVAAGVDKYSDPIAFNINEATDYLVHFATSDAHNRVWNAYATGIWYKVDATDETLTTDVSGYSAWAFIVLLADVEVQTVATTYEKSGVTTEPKIVFYNGARLGESSGSAATCPSNTWDWASDVLYVNVGADPDSGSLEAGQRDYTIVQQKSYVTIQDLHLTGANGASSLFNWINSGATSNITFQRITAASNAFTGIYVTNAHASAKTTSVLIDSCTVYDNGSSGIGVNPGTNTVTISNNTVYGNTWGTSDYQAGIHVWGNQVDGAGFVIERNNVYDTQFSGDLWSKGNGIHVDELAGAPGPIVRYNRVHDNEQLGIFVEHVRSGAQVYYNLTYGNATANLGGTGILIYRGMAGASVYNNTSTGNQYGLGAIGEPSGDTYTDNIFKNNIISGNVRQFYAAVGGENDGARGSGNVYTNNALGAQAASFITWGTGNDLNTYDAWETAYGATTSSVEADPLLVSASDFRLQPASPAINAGVGVGLYTDFVGNPVPSGSTPDIGAYETQEGTPPPPNPSTGGARYPGTPRIRRR